MLAGAGFHSPEFYASLTGKPDDQSGLQVVLARK
jgi:hypothetical protein